MSKKLYRSKRHRVLGGVCGGLAEYLQVDVVLIRAVWVLVGLVGHGIIAYILAWVIMPEGSESAEETTSGGSPRGIGYVLIGLGAYFLLRRYLPVVVWPWRTALTNWWPLLLVGLGLLLLSRRD